MDRCRLIERSIIKKYRSTIWNPFIGALKEYAMIQPEDRIGVCISGGKDSMLMAKCLQELMRHGSEEKQTHSPCYLCARMRRGYLYKYAQQLGCNKIALGHHFDDVIETTLMSMLYGAEMRTMLPKLHSTHFPGMELIRPLYFVKERDILAWVRYNELHFIQCACTATDGSRGSGSKRAEVKALIADLRRSNPQIENNIFRSAENVNLQTVLGYHDGENRTTFLEAYARGSMAD